MSNKFTVPQLLKGFFATCLIGVVFGAIYMAAMGNFSQKQCNLPHDQCLIQAADDERKVRDAFTNAKNQELIDFSTKINAEIHEQEVKSNTIINGYKDQLSPPTIETEYKANRLQNVPDRLLKLMVPEAKADAPVAGDISLNTDKVFSQNYDSPDLKEPEPLKLNIFDGRYDAVLAKYNAPYQGIPIDKYCRDAGLVQWRCDIMVGVAQQESQMGKDYHCIQQTDRHSIELGQTYYFNPMGLKYPGKKGRSADFNGCFLRKFESWDDFWQFMPKSFLDKDMMYYIGNWSTVEELSGIWKNGNIANINKEWYTTVKGVVNKI